MVEIIETTERSMWYYNQIGKKTIDDVLSRFKNAQTPRGGSVFQLQTIVVMKSQFILQVGNEVM